MEVFAACVEKLDVLKSMGHLTDAEYDTQRQKLVDDYVGQPLGGARKATVTLAPAVPRGARRGGRVALPPSVAAALARARGGAYGYGAHPYMAMGGGPHGPYLPYGGGYAPYPPMPQRPHGPRTAVKVEPIPEGVEVDEVIANFQPFGTVTSAVVKQGTPRFAYVNFASEDDAREASHAHIVLAGQLCTLILKRTQQPVAQPEAEPSEGIGIFNLPFAMSQEDVTDMLSAYPGFQTLRYITTQNGQFRGYVFAYFDTAAQAGAAKAQLQGATVQGQVLDVKDANRRKQDVGV